MSALTGPALRVAWDVDDTQTELDPHQLDSLSGAMTCCICYEEYSDTHLPMCIVPCGHTACASCLARLQQANCPECREPIQTAVFNHSVKVLAKLLRSGASPAVSTPESAPQRSPHPPPSVSMTRATRLREARDAVANRGPIHATARNLGRQFEAAAEGSPVRSLASTFSDASL